MSHHKNCGDVVLAYKAAIDCMIAELADASENHFSIDPELDDSGIMDGVEETMASLRFHLEKATELLKQVEL